MARKITRERLDAFLSRYQTTEQVLDVGAGGSAYDSFFPNRTTVDVDPERRPDVIADAHALPFPDASYSFVLSTEMLEHVQDPRTVANELLRVLAPGGTLILTTRFTFPLHDIPGDYWRFTRYSLTDLFKDEEILALESETGTFSTIGALLQRISFQSEVVGGRITKLLLRILAHIFLHLDWLIIREYGDIARKNATKDILSTGYHLAVRKRDRATLSA